MFLLSFSNMEIQCTVHQQLYFMLVSHRSYRTCIIILIVPSPSKHRVFMVLVEFAPMLTWFKSFKLHVFLLEMTYRKLKYLINFASIFTKGAFTHLPSLHIAQMVDPVDLPVISMEILCSKLHKLDSYKLST